MANVAKMWQFFAIVRDVIDRMADGKPQTKEVLTEFMLRVLTICDGMEGPEDWNGIALVAQENLPDEVEEINDGFLHDAWAES